MTYKELAERYNDMVVCVRQMEIELHRSDAVFEDLASDIYSLKQSPLIYPGDLEDEIEDCRREAYKKSDEYRKKADELQEKLHTLSGNDEKIEALIEKSESSSIYLDKALEQFSKENFANEEITASVLEMLDAMCEKSPIMDERYWTEDACSREDLLIPAKIPETEEIKTRLNNEKPRKSVRDKLLSLKEKVSLQGKKKDAISPEIGGR